jgi:hypothetical protein
VLASVAVAAHLSHIESAIHRLLGTEHHRGEWFAIEMDQPRLDMLVTQAQDALRHKQSAQAEAPMTVEKMTAIIAERVHTVRKLRGWSQRELAKRSELHYVSWRSAQSCIMSC